MRVTSTCWGTSERPSPSTGVWSNEASGQSQQADVARGSHGLAAWSQTLGIGSRGATRTLVAASWRLRRIVNTCACAGLVVVRYTRWLTFAGNCAGFNSEVVSPSNRLQATVGGLGVNMPARWADEGSAAAFPISRATFQVSDSHNLDLVLGQMVYNLVGEPTDQDTPCLRVGVGCRSDFGLSLDVLDGGGDGIEQLGAQARSLRFVPADRSGEFVRSGSADLDATPHRPRIPFAIRRLTCSQGSSLTLPAFRSATRSSISAIQAVSASGSAGPSRLASSSAAICALASASSCSASASTASVGLVTSVIYSEGRLPTTGCRRRWAAWEVVVRRAGHSPTAPEPGR